MSKPILKNIPPAQRCSKKEQRFCAVVWDFYQTHGRHELPWRKTKNPYHILVSEIMLQQTQVERVLPKYKSFIAAFPTVEDLAATPLKDVLMLWQGLGYNRRAKLLWQCAETVVRDCGGKFPRTYESLKALPGIGPYTAGAVMAFAYNKPVPLIETNVRTVYLHHFWPPDATDVTDQEILARVTRTLPTADARHWYAALMDYGSYLKKTVGNHNVRAKAYQKQSIFKGSDRQLRGGIIRTLTEGKKTKQQLLKQLSSFADIRIDAQLTALIAEGMVIKTSRWYTLP